MQWCICVILHIYMFFERWTAFILLYACCRYWLIELESFYVPSCRCRYSRVEVLSVNHGVSWLIDRFEPMGWQYHYCPIFPLVDNNGIKYCLFNTKLLIYNWCLNHRDSYLVILFRFSCLWMYSLSCCWRPVCLCEGRVNLVSFSTAELNRIISRKKVLAFLTFRKSFWIWNIVLHVWF